MSHRTKKIRTICTGFIIFFNPALCASAFVYSFQDPGDYLLPILLLLRKQILCCANIHIIYTYLKAFNFLYKTPHLNELPNKKKIEIVFISFKKYRSIFVLSCNFLLPLPQFHITDADKLSNSVIFYSRHLS